MSKKVVQYLTYEEEMELSKVDAHFWYKACRAAQLLDTNLEAEKVIEETLDTFVGDYGLDKHRFFQRRWRYTR